jgi:RNA polymerase-binding transcription factor
MDVERARELLAAERRELERALGNRGQQEDGEIASFQEPSNLASLNLDKLDEAVAADLQERFEAVERAEKRLVTGTYGLSIESGEPIPDERLEAFPTAERDRGGGTRSELTNQMWSVTRRVFSQRSGPVEEVS